MTNGFGEISGINPILLKKQEIPVFNRQAIAAPVTAVQCRATLNPFHLCSQAQFGRS